MIYRDHGLEGDSNKTRKNYARSCRADPVLPPPNIFVNKIKHDHQKSARIEDYCITFTEAKERRLVHPHNDALIIPLCISNATVRRILVDNGSSVNIIYKKAFDWLVVRSVLIKPVSVPLTSFMGPVMPIGSVKLHVSIGDFPA